MSEPTSDASPRPLGVAIIGFGFMGETHLSAWLAAMRAPEETPVQVRAICDHSRERLRGRFEAGDEGPTGNLQTDDSLTPTPDELVSISLVGSLDDVLSDPTIDIVDVCTHTDSHVETARRALAAGKHVLVEKPVDLDADAIRSLAADAARSGRLCVPAMCMRHWPGWTWLIDAVSSERYGRTLSAGFERMGTGPDWAHRFYQDPNRSGGALADLHVHDVDIVVKLFGMPQAVTSVGNLIHLTTIFHYGQGDDASAIDVCARGSWAMARNAGFRMQYTVAFEHATAVFDLSEADAPLMVHEDALSYAPDIPNENAYERQVRAFADAVRRSDMGAPIPELPTLDEAARVMDVIAAERTSLMSGRSVGVTLRD